MTRVAWEIRPPWPVRTVLLGLLLVASAVLTLWAALSSRFGGTPVVLLGSVWTFLVAVHLYRSLFRAAHRIDIEDGVLWWRSLTRQGSFPLGDLWELRPERCGAGQVLETVTGGKVLVLAPRTITGLSRHLQQACPDLPVRLPPGARFVRYVSRGR